MSNGRGIAFGVAAYLAWGLLSPGNEILLGHVSPMWMQAMRALIAAALIIAWIGPKHIKPSLGLLRPGPMLTALVMGTFLSFLLFTYSQTRLDAAYATLGFYTAPLWTALLARWWLKEHVGVWFLPAIVVMLFGGWVTLTGGSGASPDILGLAMAIGAGATWGAFAVLLRRDGEHVPWRHVLLASMLLGSIAFTLLAVVLEPLPAFSTWTSEAWGWTLAQALIPTVVAMGLYQQSLRLAPAGLINILVAFELLGTVFFAWLLLDFVLMPVQVAGLTLCMAAVSGYLWWRSDPRNEQATNDQQSYADNRAD